MLFHAAEQIARLIDLVLQFQDAAVALPQLVFQVGNPLGLVRRSGPAATAPSDQH